MTTIRPATAINLAVVGEMHAAWQEEYQGYQPWSDLLAGFLNPYFLVAENDGRVVGYIAAEHRKTFKDVHISDLYVRKEFRDVGVGHLLLGEVVRKAAQEHIHLCRLAPRAVVTALPNLVRFYARHGFRWENDVYMVRVEGSATE